MFSLGSFAFRILEKKDLNMKCSGTFCTQRRIGNISCKLLLETAAYALESLRRLPFVQLLGYFKELLLFS